MKAHLVIVAEPGIQGTQFGLCGECVINAHPVLGWTGAPMRLRESVMDFRGLCRICKKAFLARVHHEEKEWVYALTMGADEEVTE